MIWLIGAGGMLGREVWTLLDGAGQEYTATDLETDITDYDQVKRAGAAIRPGWIINCSAYTAVDAAEDEPEKAFAVNERGVRNIARAAAEAAVPVIHVSTDYVFPGTARVPLTEDDPPAPVGVYGKSKLAGEKALQDEWEKHYIVRTSWLYGRWGNNFVSTMLRLMNERETIKVVDDQHGSPTYTVDLARFFLRIIESPSSPYGIYHFSGEGETTWYGFAKEIYKVGREYGLITSDCSVVPCTSAEYPTKAVRPSYSLLSKEKIGKTFGTHPPHWKESLRHICH